jgi:hypothetical protein
VAVAAAVLLGVALLLLAGLVERGYLSRAWRRTSRLGRGRRFDADRR